MKTRTNAISSFISSRLSASDQIFRLKGPAQELIWALLSTLLMTDEVEENLSTDLLSG